MARFSWSVVAATLVLLAACSGIKAGGDGDGACPAGSVANVFPPSARVTAGTAAISFGGGATNCTEMSRWSLTGPGSIDRVEGVPVYYTPPAAVASTTTATLDMTVGGLTASATITIDPSVLELHGQVIAVSGAPIAGAVVRVGTGNATTDAHGGFSLAGVTVPYQLTATSPDGLLTSIYPGLRRTDPTLVIFDVDGTYPRSGLVTGALSGGAGFPQPAGHEAGVTFKAGQAAATGPVAAGASTFLLGAWWTGGSSVVGEVHALQWLTGTLDRPVSYDGVASRTGVALSDLSTASGQDLALGAISSTAISGTILNTPAGDSASISMFGVFPDGARIRILPRPSDPSQFPYTGFTSTFSLVTPSIPGGSIDLVSRQDYAGSTYQEVHRHGLAPNATDVNIRFDAVPVQDTPVIGSIVGVGATFTWFGMPGFPVYAVSFRGPPGQPGFDVFTTAQALTIPADFPLPASQSYTWKVRGSTAFHTVEDAAGPGGFHGSAPAYVIAQGSDWPFTTAP